MRCNVKKDEGSTERVPEQTAGALPEKMMLPRFLNMIHFYKKTSALETAPQQIGKILPLAGIQAAAAAAGECYVRESDFLPEDIFREVLSFERKRAERTHKPVILMLLDLTGIDAVSDRFAVTRHVAQTLTNQIKTVSNTGWYRDREVLGVILAEAEGDTACLEKKIKDSLPPGLCGLTPCIAYRFISFPEAGEQVQQAESALFYPDLPGHKRRAFSLFFKRAMDIIGGATGILLFLPLFIVLPVCIKMTSKGPVLFKQERIGQHGKKFTFLKFRTMTAGNDPTIHQEYIKKLIREQKSYEKDPEKRPGVYKISNDPRVTPIGRFLRKTSLDELPQFFNVLKGEMSLVGPRPPIPYEVENYELWHLRRVMEIKPGITGLWQVNGRSSTSFDEMVRLDLKYAREWTLWMDIRILLKTPWAVIAGKGAY